MFCLVKVASTSAASAAALLSSSSSEKPAVALGSANRAAVGVDLARHDLIPWTLLEFFFVLEIFEESFFCCPLVLRTFLFAVVVPSCGAPMGPCGGGGGGGGPGSGKYPGRGCLKYLLRHVCFVGSCIDTVQCKHVQTGVDWSWRRAGSVPVTSGGGGGGGNGKGRRFGALDGFAIELHIC